METLSAILLLAAAVVGVILLIKLLSAPIRKIFKFLINALIGFLMLVVLNFFGSAFGVTLELSLINILVTAILGFPGLILLVLIHLFL